MGRFQSSLLSYKKLYPAFFLLYHSHGLRVRSLKMRSLEAYGCTRAVCHMPCPMAFCSRNTDVPECCLRESHLHASCEWWQILACAWSINITRSYSSTRGIGFTLKPWSEPNLTTQDSQKKHYTHLFIWTPLISGLGLGPRCSLNVISRCLLPPPLPLSASSDDTGKNDKSLVTLSCDGDRNMRHDNGVAGAVDVRCLLILCVISSFSSYFLSLFTAVEECFCTIFRRSSNCSEYSVE